MSEASLPELLFEASWKSALIAGLALLLVRLLHRRSAAERACVAHAGMAAIALVPLLVLAGPRLPVDFLPSPAPVPAAIVAADPSPIQTQGREALAPASPEQRAAASLPDPSPTPASNPVALANGLAMALYALPAALLLLITLVAILRLFALRGRASIIVDHHWLHALALAQRRMGIKSGTALLASSELRSPVSWGVLRPIILLSEEALEQPAVAEAIIAHELAHVARFDWFNLLVARVATACFWFNPLVWMLARQSHQLREEAADDAVLGADVLDTDYAALLVGVARHESKGMLLAAHGVAPRKGSLSLRVHRILEPALRRGPAHLVWGGACTAGALLVAGPLAALTPVAPAAPAALPIAAPAVVAAAAPAFPAVPNVIAIPLPPSTAAPAGAATVALPKGVAAVVAPLAATVATAPPVPSAPPTSTPPAAPMSANHLVAMRAQGLDAAAVADLISAYPSLSGSSPNQLVALKIHGVTPARLRDYAALGYRDVSASRLVEWAVHGVTPDFIRSIAAEGYGGISSNRLTEFRIFGIDAAFIRAMREAGIGASAERLVELRTTGSTRGSGASRHPRARPERRPDKQPSD